MIGVKPGELELELGIYTRYIERFCHCDRLVILSPYGWLI